MGALFHASAVFSDFQPLLERLAGGFLVFVKGVGVDIQRGGGLGMPQQSCLRAIGNQQTGVAVAERFTK